MHYHLKQSVPQGVLGFNYEARCALRTYIPNFSEID